MQEQKPLTPHARSSGESPSTPPIELPPGTCALCTDRITSQLLEARTSASLDIAQLKRQLETAQHELSDARQENESLRRERDEERQQHSEKYREMQSRLERAEQDLTAARLNKIGPFDSETAQARKQQLFDRVRRGQFGRNAAAPSEQIQREGAQKLEEKPCQKN